HYAFNLFVRYGGLIQVNQTLIKITLKDASTMATNTVCCTAPGNQRLTSRCKRLCMTACLHPRCRHHFIVLPLVLVTGFRKSRLYNDRCVSQMTMNAWGLKMISSTVRSPRNQPGYLHQACSTRPS
ncbi:MAG: hypothetical protein REI12_14360, partial [Pedobacter sp.]|nr:hypothetical protein [Pedobacter sp.]